MKKEYRDKHRAERGGGPRGRPDARRGEEWLYGLNPVLEAVRSGRKVKSVFLSRSRREAVPLIEQEILSRGIELKKSDQFFFDSRFPKGHQGVAAVVAPREYTDLEELLDIPFQKNEAPFFLILDCVEDPRNFGAILRVADAGGVHGVVIQEHRSATLSPEAVKASAGASEHVPVCLVANIKHAMRSMKNEGITLLGAEAEAGEEVWKTDLSVPLAFVVGSEGKGLRRTVRDGCDILVSLPMKGRMNSLNVSVAAGILIFESLRQRLSINKK